MKNKDSFNLKFLNQYYIKQKENEIKKLENKKSELISSCEAETLNLKNNELELERLNGENRYLNEQLSKLKQLILENGVIISIEHSSYHFKEWENLLLSMKGADYTICSKKGEELYKLDEDYKCIIEEFFKERYNYSLVIIRVESKTLKLQLRFLK
jgi:hypothetical protein